MKRITFYRIVLILSLIILFSCDNKEDAQIDFDENSKALVSKGITFTVGGGDITLVFNHIANAYISALVSSSTDGANWLSAKCEAITDTQSKVTIKALNNDALTERDGNVVLRVNDTKLSLNIVQSTAMRIMLEQHSFVVPNKESNIIVECQTNGELRTLLKMDQPEWIKISDISKNGYNYKVSLSIEENKSLGRVAGLVLQTTDGTSDAISIRQQPRAFNESEDIITGGEGKLSVLLGDDINNLRHIRSLKIQGRIDEGDVPSIKQLFIAETWATNPNEYPIQMDLSNSTFCGKSDGFTTPDGKVLFYDYELPESMFYNAGNLTSIKLPINTQIIGSFAFSGCNALCSIDIPDDVKYIKYGAFSHCENLKNINFSRSSMLLSLEGYVFDTGTRLSSLNIPASLTDIDISAFFCACEQLYVSWQNPPEIRVLPYHGCTLFVPKGTKEKYLSSPSWKRFSKIEEY
ncbi:MAG TPA: leucine-rich repeat domain-containing protein [Xylanibacter oryzae]|nr:leucine-rich repeat domain-containing protein [Xylanibacter oryzae]